LPLNCLIISVAVTRPETVIITNALTSHIERLKTKYNIFLAKCEILNYNPKNAILPYEERFLDLNINNINIFYVGENSSCKIDNIMQNNNEIIYEIIDNSKHKMKIYSLFLHNIHNSLFAYRVGKIYGLTDEEIRKGLLKFKQEKLHEEYTELEGITIINDCYNASYESMSAALYSLKNYCIENDKTPCALLGDMLELGEESFAFHERIAELCKRLGVKKLFYKGENYEIFHKHIENAVFINNTNESFAFIKQYLSTNDVLLVKGSRNMNLEKILLN
jgi:UDP-N-acetylmuramoyl-tripeptide--D-alanyl-D-alanine ligase